MTNAAAMWKTGGGLGFASPVIYKNHLFADLGDGFCCVEMDTGKIGGKLPGGGISSSLVGADGRLFRQGTGRDKAGVKVYRMDPDNFGQLGDVYTVPHANSVTAAIVDGRLYVRGRDRMHCYDLRAAAKPWRRMALIWGCGSAPAHRGRFALPIDPTRSV